MNNQDLSDYMQRHQQRLDKVSELYNQPKVAKVFLITEDQMSKANELIKLHQQEKHQGKAPYAGAIGGSYSWTFSETGLGQTQGIKCMCGEYLCLTDFSDW